MTTLTELRSMHGRRWSLLPHASRSEILKAHGLDASGVAATVLERPKAA